MGLLASSISDICQQCCWSLSKDVNVLESTEPTPALAEKPKIAAALTACPPLLQLRLQRASKDEAMAVVHSKHATADQVVANKSMLQDVSESGDKWVATDTTYPINVLTAARMRNTST